MTLGRVLHTKIGRRVFIIFLPVAFVPLFAIGWVATTRAQTEIHRQTLAALQAATDGAEAQLREFLDDLKGRTLAFGLDALLRDSVETLKPEDSSSSATAVTALRSTLTQQKARFSDSEEMFVMDLKGRTLSSTATSQEGRDYSSSDFFIKGRQAVFVSDVFRDPVTDRVTWVVAAPISSRSNGQVIGVLADRIDPRELSDLTSGRRIKEMGADTQSFRMGETGETFIVDRNKLMVTDSRFLPDVVLKKKVDIAPVRIALSEGKETAGDYDDYRGKRVSGASMIIREPDWIVITQIDFSQAFMPMRRLQKAMIPLALGLTLPLGFLAWGFTSKILNPLEHLRNAEAALVRGERGNPAEIFVADDCIPDDELGKVIQSRNERVKTLLEQQRELEARTTRLEETVRSLEGVCYHLVHDLRAPLRAMQGFSGLLLDQYRTALDPRGQDFARRIADAATRMDSLISDLLEFGTLGHVPLPLGSISLANVIQSTLAEFSQEITARGARIDVSQPLPNVQANAMALQKVVHHLLSNALKFVETGVSPVIRISCEERPGWVRLVVRDNGIGIAPEFQGRIFSIFERLQKPGEEYPGTGIGLAIVSKAIERMGGHFGVESEINHGSTFWIELPVA
jgi:signal transduction histidine kinase